MESLSSLGTLVQELTLYVTEIDLYAKPLQDSCGSCIGTSNFRLLSRNSREVSIYIGFVQRVDFNPLNKNCHPMRRFKTFEN